MPDPVSQCRHVILHFSLENNKTVPKRELISIAYHSRLGLYSFHPYKCLFVLFFFQRPQNVNT